MEYSWKWTHVLGKTWCLDGPLTIPVWFADETNVVLLDSGYADRDRAAIDALLAEKNCHVSAIIGSHSHNDHSGNHAYYQKTHGAEIILPKLEAAVVEDLRLLVVQYPHATVEDMPRLFPHLALKADRTFGEEETTVNVCGGTFGLIFLPGHTEGQTGIVTPDGVCYAADAVMDDVTSAKAKLPTSMNWQKDAESKEKLMKTDYPVYLLAHRGCTTDIKSLIRRNLDDRECRLAEYCSWLTEQKEWSKEEIRRLLYNRLQVGGRTEIARIIFRRNVDAAMEQLMRLKKLERTFRDGNFYYSLMD